MTSAVFLVILCIGIMSGASAHDPSLDAEWEEWKMDYEKSYSLEEEAMRRAVWEKNLKIIKDHNGENGLGKNGFTMEMNEFGDMTGEEFKDMMVNIPVPPHNKWKSLWKRSVGYGGLPKFVDWRKDLPEFVNWRKEGYVTSVRKQGKCGSCWAFAVTGAIEGQMYHKTGKLTPLSVQNLVDCSKPHGNNGCDWGNTYNAFQYVLHNGGVEAEATYPYEGKEGPCRYDPRNSAAKIKEFVALPEGEDILMDAVATKGPIAAGIDAFHDSFLFYKKGIYHEPNCNIYVVNHAVLVVGYGHEENETYSESYWLIKNSWGKKWGLKGYMKLAKDWNNHCQISSYAQYPIV
ncbi:cathepsin Q-like isoform X1 [Peromyscus eremicus]|uniref:cathepsin Q-like isoform X1 n=1 Tax=Peromyscus eremicus TaxID=42410 RepID=UPI0027DB300A|nr:cathepsin Q-like isoform X1 [Peromyscus eremicus]